jgi:hypothetical protein
MVIELDGRAGIHKDHFSQLLPLLDQRQPAQIGAIEEQQIEREHH